MYVAIEHGRDLDLAFSPEHSQGHGHVVKQTEALTVAREGMVESPT